MIEVRESWTYSVTLGSGSSTSALGSGGSTGSREARSASNTSRTLKEAAERQSIYFLDSSSLRDQSVTTILVISKVELKQIPRQTNDN